MSPFTSKNEGEPGTPPDVPSAPVMTRWQKAKLVFKVVELRLRFVALMLVTGLVFAYWDSIWNHIEKWSRPAETRAAAASDIEFYCPMHPSVVRDEPGNCPICGMPLSKRKKGQREELPKGVTSRVQLAPFRISQAGIRTVAVGYEPLAETVTTVGNVTFDERRLARISSRIKGLSRVEKLHVNFTGTPVKQGQVLAELYSPELYQASQELLLAQRRARQPTSGPQTALGRSLVPDPGEMVRLAREKLGFWGITPAQIDAILAQGTAANRFPILSPISGVIVRKNIVEGQYVNEGEAMFEVADLAHVWVQAKVYEDQFDRIRIGQRVEARMTALPGQVFQGQVAFIDPALDETTRTVNVRYDLENPGDRILPGMYATVTLKTPVRETPNFRTRFASTKPTGDHIRLLNLSIADQKTCPVTKAKLGSMGGPISVDVEGGKVWVCCAGCPDKLKANPTKYLATGSDQTPTEGVLSVPESAVIDTGERKIVYVEAEPGIFEGKQVTLGPRVGDRFPVLDGLDPGDRVAAAGAFLIDAESRLNLGAGSAPDPGPPPTATASPSASHVH